MKDKPWTKQEYETQRAYEAFCVYRDLGPDRSLDKAYRKDGGHEGSKKPASGHWCRWCTKHSWVDRSEAYDRYLEEKRRKKHEKELTSGLSKPAERVKKLKKLHDRLEKEIFENEAYWLEDIKIGPDGVIPITRFNAQILKEYRSTLADIASEVGGRQRKVDVTTKGNSLQRDFNFVVSQDADDPEIQK